MRQLQCFNHRLLEAAPAQMEDRQWIKYLWLCMFFIFLLSPGGFRQEFYIVLFLGQFAFMYLVFDAILYRKKAGLIYRLTRRCSSKKGT